MKQDEIFNDGFVEPVAEEMEHAIENGYLMGAPGGATGPDILPSGNWSSYSPIPEKQAYTEANRWLDTNGCTLFGTLNAVEELLDFKHGVKVNLSERFLGIISGTDPRNGNDPHRVAEALRVSGCVEDADLPFSADIMTAQEFYQPNPLPQTLIQRALSWLIKLRPMGVWELKSEFVFEKDEDVGIKHTKLREALRKGPVGVSVRAWKKNDDTGLYYKSRGEADTHWCNLLRYDGLNPVIGDSYEPFEKKLTADYNFMYAKVYYTVFKEAQNIGWKIPILQKIIQLLQEALNIKHKMEQMVTPAASVPTAPLMSPLERAVMWVESRNNIYAKGDLNLKKKAYGPLQIRQPACDDVNQRFDIDVKAEDCLGNLALSLAVFRKYLDIWATPERIGRPVTDEDRARIWNGGPTGWKKASTISYWAKVKAALPQN